MVQREDNWDDEEEDEEDYGDDGTGGMGAGVGLSVAAGAPGVASGRGAAVTAAAPAAAADFFPEFPLPGSEEVVAAYQGEDLETVKRIMHIGAYGRSNGFLMDASQTLLEDLLSLCGYTDSKGNRLEPPRRTARDEEEERKKTAEMRTKEKEKRVQLTRPETITLCLDEESSPVQQLAQWYFHTIVEEVVEVPKLQNRPAVFLVNDSLLLGWTGISFQKELLRLVEGIQPPSARPKIPTSGPIFLLLSDLVDNLPPGVDLSTMTGEDFETCASFYLPVTMALMIMVVDDGTLPPAFTTCLCTAAHEHTWHLALALDLAITPLKEVVLPPPAAPKVQLSQPSQNGHAGSAAPVEATAAATSRQTRATQAAAKNPYKFFQRVKEIPGGSETWQRGPPSSLFGPVQLASEPFKVAVEVAEEPTEATVKKHLIYKIVHDTELEWEEEAVRFSRLLALESAPPPSKSKEAQEEEEEEAAENTGEGGEDGGEDDDDGDYQPEEESDTKGSRRSSRKKGKKQQKGKEKAKAGAKGKGKKKGRRADASQSPSPSPSPSLPAKPKDFSDLIGEDEGEDALGGPRMFPREPSPPPSPRSSGSGTGAGASSSEPAKLRAVPAPVTGDTEMTAAAAATTEATEVAAVDPLPYQKYFVFDRSDPSTGGTCPRMIARDLPLLSLRPMSRPITVKNIMEGPGNLWGVHKLFWNHQTGATKIPRPADAHSIIVQTPSEKPMTVFFSDHATVPRGAKKQPLFKAATKFRPTTVAEAKMGNKEESLDMVRQYHEQYLDPDHPRSAKDPSLMERPMHRFSTFFQSGRFFTPKQLPALFAHALWADAGYGARGSEHGVGHEVQGPGYDAGYETQGQSAEVIPPEDEEDAVVFWEDLFAVAPFAPRNFCLLLPRGNPTLLPHIKVVARQRKKTNVESLGDISTIYDPHAQVRSGAASDARPPAPAPATTPHSTVPAAPQQQGATTEDAMMDMDSLREYLDEEEEEDDGILGELAQQLEEEMDL